MPLFLWAAAMISAVTFVVHTFMGGKFVARPLLADKNLPKASKWLNYYCWHNTTVMIAITTGAFVWLAMNPGHRPMIFLLSVLTASVSLLSACVALKGDIHPLRFPSTSLFAMTSVFGWTALFV